METKYLFLLLMVGFVACSYAVSCALYFVFDGKHLGVGVY